jgi:hypothetical protein
MRDASPSSGRTQKGDRDVGRKKVELEARGSHDQPRQNTGEKHVECRATEMQGKHAAWCARSCEQVQAAPTSRLARHSVGRRQDPRRVLRTQGDGQELGHVAPQADRQQVHGGGVVVHKGQHRLGVEAVHDATEVQPVGVALQVDVGERVATFTFAEVRQPGIENLYTQDR